MKKEDIVTWQDTIENDIDEIRGDIRRLQEKQLIQDQIIQSIQSDLEEIKEDTKWLRRTFTNAIVTSVLTAVIGGEITVIFSLLIE
ncbi:hemolysin XhlA family protein [Bacillus canaveralius]|uniref:hemolysin XhlA family protein n=1 Tax=Bacillus canaveralius TaxID=1403243 RepID=UPI00163A1148|nr:hemolysin XhlA family protein [Bacillus canaveralius]